MSYISIIDCLLFMSLTLRTTSLLMAVCSYAFQHLVCNANTLRNRLSTETLLLIVDRVEQIGLTYSGLTGWQECRYYSRKKYANKYFKLSAVVGIGHTPQENFKKMCLENSCFRANGD